MLTLFLSFLLYIETIDHEEKREGTGLLTAQQPFL